MHLNGDMQMLFGHQEKTAREDSDYWLQQQEERAMKRVHLLPQGCLLQMVLLFIVIHHNAQHIFKFFQTIQVQFSKFQ